MSPFRFRRIRTYIDTSEQAEWDMDGFQVPESMREKIARRLLANAYSAEDRVVGSVRIREMFGYDIIYTIDRVAGDVIITIGGVELPVEDDPTEKLIERLNLTAMIRSALRI